MIDRATLKAIPPIYKSYQLYRFLSFQARLAVAMLRDWRDRQNPANQSVPPAKLRYRVHGSLDKESFLRAGQIIAQNIRDLLASINRDLSSFKHVLDFGCGSGRVLRYLRDAPASSQFYGTDIDPELVNWCERNIPGVRWSRNDYMPPTSYADNTFDLIFAISVFTHLDEAFQKSWLQELQRIARPAGILLLTVHGKHVYQTLSQDRQEILRSRGFLFLTGTTGRLKLDGLPDFYQSAYHTRDYIDREWSKYFEVLGYADQAINNHQDAVLLRKRLESEKGMG